MGSSPIERAVIALESIAESLQSIDAALHADDLKPLAEVIENGFTHLGRAVDK